MKKLVIFGTGDIASLAKFYFRTDSNYEVVAFTVDGGYMEGKDSFEGCPLVPFAEVERLYPPAEFSMFIALSYAQMNRVRESKLDEARAKGYTIASYISSHCTYLSESPPGENAFILEDNTIQPFVTIGRNVTLWSGNHIGHHSTIGDHNFVSSHVVISGHCEIGPYCFLGVNSTLAHKVTLASGTLLGAGASLTKNSEENGVYVGSRATKLSQSSADIKL